MSYFGGRDVKTTIPCPDCKTPLHIARTCHEAFMRCPQCKKQFSIKSFIQKADQQMLAFLENLYLDRI